MSFLERMLKFLFWFFVVTGVVKLLGRVIGRAAGGQRAGSVQGPEALKAQRRLVRDPVCGMHMAEELALPLQANGDVLYFCSEGCRSKYEHSMVRRKVSA